MKTHYMKVKLIVLLMLVTTLAIAQDTSVSGKVTDENGGGLPGALVAVTGTTTGTVTDIDGNFNLNAPSNGTLSISYIGYETQEVSIGGRSTIDIQMKVDAGRLLDELVVIGYGTVQKQQMTGSVTSVETEKMALNPMGNVTQSLQGMAAGVTVTGSNRPGQDAKIRIRGLGTINNNEPLYVIDGAFATSGINQISPSDIESLTVLKDAAATAIYGARGANGVILITTKKGKKNQAPAINFTSRVGAIHNSKQQKTLNREELGEWYWLGFSNSGVAPNHPLYGNGPTPKIPNFIQPAGATTVDLSTYDVGPNPITASSPNGNHWYDAVVHDGVTQEYTMSITGGSANTTYAFGLGYLDEEGMLKKTGFERYTFRSNISTTLTPWLEVGQNIGITHSDNWGFQTEGGEGSTFGILMDLNPLFPIYDVMGNPSPISRIVGLNSGGNPVGDAEKGKDITRKKLGLLGNAYAKITIMEDLKFQTLFGINTSDYRFKEPLEANPDSWIARVNNQLTESSTVSRLWNWTNTINYSKTINDNHEIDVLLGAEAISNESRSVSASREGYLLTSSDYFVIDAGSGTQRNSGSASDWSTMSYFGRIHYGFSGKYLADVTVRRDGSSRFGKNERWGTFPSFALGWLVSSESFMDGSASWIDYLKVRASWGKSGNDQIGNYNGFTTFRTSPEFSYYPVTGSNNSIVPGFESLAFGNPNAKWETNRTINLGFDATLFNLIDLGIDIWQRKTEDMLYPKAIPWVRGRANTPSVNIGEMENKGIDIQLNIDGAALNNELTYSFTATFSHYKNEVVKLTDVEEEFILGTSFREQVYTRSEPGTSFPEFFGYDIIGIFDTQAQVDGHPEAFGAGGTYNQPGRWIYRDVNGDNVIDDKDRTYIGNPHPDFTAGFVAQAGYKNFDIVANFYASVGNDILNLDRRVLDFSYFSRNRGTDALYKSWGSPYLSDNSKAKLPKVEVNDRLNQVPSTHYVQDGSYLRLQSLQIGYNIPERIASKIALKNARIYVMGTNLFTLTGYNGLDPSITTTDRNFGIDAANWPKPQRFMVGINIGL
ncbi:MAG: TonB-dependent receptor [Bacteroidetes bacterium]|nr:TonB-dependent receptor [Bacteroidota bacterium]MDA1120778.1 TonB-dependent receptor [Bacteroidota bacterium]